MHYAAVSLVGLQVSNESTLLLSLAVDRLRTVLAVKGSLRRAEDGAPLTAPGRSEEPYLIRRERRIGKSMTLTAQHLATFNRRDHVRATKPRGTCTAAGGWMPKISRRPARGRDFSLDIPFYRTGITERISKSKSFVSVDTGKFEWTLLRRIHFRQYPTHFSSQKRPFTWPFRANDMKVNGSIAVSPGPIIGFRFCAKRVVFPYACIH